PTLVYESFVVGQLFGRKIAREECLEDCLGGEHSALDRGVNSLQTLRVEKTGAVPGEQHSVSVRARHCEITAGGYRLRAVTDHLATFEQFRNVRVSFVELKLGVRIDQGIFVVETGDVTKAQHSILQAVDPAAAVRVCVRGKTERVSNTSGWITIVGQLPQLFHTDAVELRFASVVETEAFDKFLG